MRIPKIGVASAAMLAALAVGGALPALAQDATEDPTTQETETAPEADATTPDGRHAAMRTELAEALAAELGLDAETVAAALETVQTQLAERRRAEHAAALQERLDAAVADGSLTQEQADALLEAHESGVLRGFGRHGGHRGPGGPGGFFGPGRFLGPGDDDASAPAPEDAADTTASA